MRFEYSLGRAEKYDLSIAIDLIKLFEGFRSHPYLCPAGVPTIGYGSTVYPSGEKVSLSDPSITKIEAENIMRFWVLDTTDSVARLCPRLYKEAIQRNSWGRFCSIVDFAYNLGVGRLQTSTLRRVINSASYDSVPQQLMRWVRSGGVVTKGLVKRRKAECAFWA